MGDMIRDLPPAASPETTERRNQLFLGTFVHSKTREELDYLHDTAVCVDASGTIVAVETACDLKRAEGELLPRLGWTASDVDVRVGKEGQFFFPGFIGMFAFCILIVPSSPSRKGHVDDLPLVGDSALRHEQASRNVLLFWLVKSPPRKQPC